MKKIPERNEIAQKDKWAIEDLYASPALWQEDLKKLQELGQKLAAFSGKLHISAQNLLDYMHLNEQVSVLYDTLGNYAYRRADEDTRVAEFQNLVGQLTENLCRKDKEQNDDFQRVRQLEAELFL